MVIRDLVPILLVDGTTVSIPVDYDFLVAGVIDTPEGRIIVGQHEQPVSTSLFYSFTDCCFESKKTVITDYDVDGNSFLELVCGNCWEPIDDIYGQTFSKQKFIARAKS